LTAAIRNYLDQRKSSGLGAATVTEIYKAIKAGGYKFETSNEENQKISVGNALRKTSSIFHRLPTGYFGLLAWYPSAKPKPEAAGSTKTKKKSGRPTNKLQKASGAPRTNGSVVTFKEVRDIILEQQGHFSKADIEAATRAKFPSKEIPKTKIPSVIFILKKDKGLLKEISARTGKKGAVYTNI